MNLTVIPYSLISLNGNVAPPPPVATQFPMIVRILCGLHSTNPTLATDLFIDYVRTNPRDAVQAIAALSCGDLRALQTMSFLLGALKAVDAEAVKALFILAQGLTYEV